MAQAARAKFASDGDESTTTLGDGRQSAAPDLLRFPREALGKGNAESDLNFEDVFITTSDYRLVASTSRMFMLGQRGD